MHFVFFVTTHSATKLQYMNVSQTWKENFKNFSAQEYVCLEARQISTVYFPSDFKIASSGVERPLQTSSLATRFTYLISACAQL